MRVVIVFAFAAAAMLLQGCTTLQTAVDSSRELGVSLFAPPRYSDKAYYERLKPLNRSGPMKDEEKAFVYDYIDIINANYIRYVGTLSTGRAATNITYDTINLGLTGGAAVASAVSVKTGLAAMSTFFQGQKQSVDKNIFNDQAVFSLTSVMEVRRTQVLTRIREKMLAGDYALGDALIDLDEYYRAGSMQNALQASYLNQANLPTKDQKDKKPGPAESAAPALPASTSAN